MKPFAKKERVQQSNSLLPNICDEPTRLLLTVIFRKIFSGNQCGNSVLKSSPCCHLTHTEGIRNFSLEDIFETRLLSEVVISRTKYLIKVLETSEKSKK